MVSLKDFVPGQTAWLINSRTGFTFDSTSEVTIEKVGNKYVTLKEGWKRQYYLKSDGDEYLVEKTQYSSYDMLFPTEESMRNYMERIHTIQYIERNLNKYIYNTSLEQLRKLKQMIDGE
jgi:hypothetical protein